MPRALPGRPLLLLALLLLAVGLFALAEAREPSDASDKASLRPYIAPDATSTPAPTPLFAPVEDPTIKPRTPVPGADQGGLFGDGRINLPPADTSGWLTYSNARYGYSFKYPPDWEMDESDNIDVYSHYNGAPAYPRHSVRVTNPRSGRGENIYGVTCFELTCIGSLPTTVGFYVSISNAECSIPGTLLVSDLITIDGRPGKRCIIESVNDGSRVVWIHFPIAGSGDLLSIALERGRSVSAAQQAVLDSVYSTFRFTP